MLGLRTIWVAGLLVLVALAETPAEGGRNRPTPAAGAESAKESSAEGSEATGNETCPAASEWQHWDGHVQLGLYGTQSSSRTFSLRLAARGQRRVKWGELSVAANYHRRTRDGQVTANRLACEIRHQWLSDMSPWTEFVQGSVDLDQFAAYDARLSASGGLGYRFVETETTSVSGRIGGGLVHHLGLAGARPDPELLAALDLDHRFSKRHKLSTAFQYSREGSRLDRFTVTARADWEILLSEEKNVSLNLSIEDRLRSWGGPNEPSALDYSVTLMWKF